MPKVNACVMAREPFLRSIEANTLTQGTGHLQRLVLLSETQNLGRDTRPIPAKVNGFGHALIR